MNDQELNSAVWRDLAVIYQSSTLQRLQAEYNQERRKRKISTASRYTRYYPIRTKAKNNWLIYLEKAPILQKYRGEQDISFHCLAYYYGPKGLTVFKPDYDASLTYVYQGHVFTRYSQRMQLSLNTPIEKVEHFFTYNAYSDHRFIKQNHRQFAVGICHDGILLGEYRAQVKWIYNRTFVNREIFNRYQDLAEMQAIDETKAWIKSVVAKKLNGAMIFKKANMNFAIYAD